VATIHSLIEQVMAQQHVPGLALGIQRGEERLAWYRGCANLEHGVAVSEKTVFEIASVTKLFTAQAVLILAQAGQIKLDDPLATYLTLPDTWQAITVRHALAHQSGSPSYTDVSRYWDMTREAKLHSQVLDLVRELPLTFAPGSRHAYDNTGFYLLGLLIETISGQPYGDCLRTRIFEPLGMEQTQANDYDRIVLNRAQGYHYRDGVISNKAFYDTSNTFSAGNLLSTVGDLLGWSASLFDNSMLSDSYRRLWWTPHPSQAGNEREHRYTMGLGWFIVDSEVGQFYGHNGSVAGFGSAFLYVPTLNATAVVLCNAGHVHAPHQIALQALQTLE
jgi:D-alanyl-D-alanine carboxypeptidase